MLEKYRPFYTSLLKPLSRLFTRLDISPNAITGIGITIFCIGAVLTATGYWKTSIFLLALGSFMDGVDGIIARQNKKKSVFGSILDSVSDRLTEIIWICGIMFFYLLNFPGSKIIYCAVYGAITGSLMVSYVKARAEGAGIECKEGFFQRPERLISLGFFQLLGPKIMVYGLLLIAIITYATALQRMHNVFKTCTKNNNPN